MHVFEHRRDLLGYQRWIEGLNPRNPGGVLNRNQRNRRRAEHSELMESFEIGLNACAAAGIGTGDAQRDGDHGLTLYCA
jgi:hypothetical protein